MRSRVFEAVCETLLEHSTLDRLAARGTVRIALGEAGLDARQVTKAQMQVVLGELLPKELRDRGVTEADRICQACALALDDVEDAGSEAGDRIDGFFRRTL